MLTLAKDLTLPLDAVTRTFGILAVRGAGKSNTAAVMAEEMFGAKLPFVAIDPVGSWFGLRSSADGTTPALSIPIFGGKHGDMPLERGAGELLADLIVEKRLTCVLDLSRFETEADKKAFLLAFAKRLYQRNEDPLHLFLEEADDYIPQIPMGDEKHLLRAWENIVRRGRSRGLGMTIITQRSAAVAKMVLTQVETLFAMRTTGPQDIAAIEAWVKYHQVGREVLSTLSGLDDGEAWVWSPHYLKTMSRHQIRRRKTFDSGATPANVRAKDTRPPATLADIDLTSLQERMAATIEKAKADDPRELRKQIADLRRQLAKGTAQPNPKTEPIRQPPTIIEKPVITDAQLARVEKTIDRFEQLTARMQEAFSAPLGAIRGQLAELVAGVKAVRQPQLPMAPARPAVPTRPVSNRSIPTHAVKQSLSPADGAITGPELKILTALAELEALGLHPADKQQLGLLAGYTNVRSGGFSEPLGRLMAAGFSTAPRPGHVAITDAGRAIVGPVSPPESSEELQARIIEKLTGPEQKLLRVLIAQHPESMTKEELAAACDPPYTNIRSGGFSEPLGHMNTLGLVDSPARGVVVASRSLFLEER